MTEPPYSYPPNNQRPKYLNDLNVTWSGVPLMNKKVYICKVSADASTHAQIQAQDGVIDFPNIFTDRLDQLPSARIAKNAFITKALNISKVNGNTVKDLVNHCANVEVNHGWDFDSIYCGE